MWKGTPIQGEGGVAREGEIMEVYNGKGNFVVLALPTDRQTDIILLCMQNTYIFNYLQGGKLNKLDKWNNWDAKRSCYFTRTYVFLPQVYVIR